MDPIDLVPGNFRAISSLITQEQGKFRQAGMTPGFSRLKAYEAVAPLIRPPVTPSELASWVGAQSRQIQLRQDGAALPLPASGGKGNGQQPPKWTLEQAWSDDEPDVPHTHPLKGPSITQQLVKALTPLRPGCALSTVFESKGEGRRWQAIASQAINKIGWEKGSYKTSLIEIDKRWKLKVTRL